MRAPPRSGDTYELVYRRRAEYPNAMWQADPPVIFGSAIGSWRLWG
ncbi:hypothetical protein AB0H00_24660 [Nocardia sp. NPDC023852]